MQDNEKPKVLGMKIWHIDNKPVFYGYPEDSHAYSVPDKGLVEKPGYLSMFPSRDVGPADLSQLVMHGQIEDGDFERLSKKGLIPEELGVLHQKVQELKKELEVLRVSMSPTLTKANEEEEAVPLQESDSGLISAILDIVKASSSDGGLSGSVFDRILAGTKGLSIEETKIIELVKKHVLKA